MVIKNNPYSLMNDPFRERKPFRDPSPRPKHLEIEKPERAAKLFLQKYGERAGLLTRRRVNSRYFISHAYKDQWAIEVLKTSLPANVEPVIFPPIDVPASRAVSGDLIANIEATDGLIFLQSPESNKSFWVNFERRVASRRGMPVVAFDPTARATKQFARATDFPQNLFCGFWNASIAFDNEVALAVLERLKRFRGVEAQYFEQFFIKGHEKLRHAAKNGCILIRSGSLKSERALSKISRQRCKLLGSKHQTLGSLKRLLRDEPGTLKRHCSRSSY
jgi:hypothetical protein